MCHNTSLWAHRSQRMKSAHRVQKTRKHLQWEKGQYAQFGGEHLHRLIHSDRREWSIHILSHAFIGFTINLLGIKHVHTDDLGPRHSYDLSAFISSPSDWFLRPGRTGIHPAWQSMVDAFGNSTDTTHKVIHLDVPARSDNPKPYQTTVWWRDERKPKLSRILLLLAQYQINSTPSKHPTLVDSGNAPMSRKPTTAVVGYLLHVLSARNITCVRRPHKQHSCSKGHCCFPVPCGLQRVCA